MNMVSTLLTLDANAATNAASAQANAAAGIHGRDKNESLNRNRNVRIIALFCYTTICIVVEERYGCAYAGLLGDGPNA